MASRTESCGIAVVGGGIVGLAVAGALQAHRKGSLLVLEAEERPATHQTGHNSGVIHSGLYYRPGSLKARNCATGREEMYRFCEEAGVPHERCGKLVVAVSEDERPRLDDLEQRGRANGIRGIRRLGPEASREREPHVRAIESLWVPETGIVDFREVARAMVRRLEEGRVEVRTRARVRRILRRPDGFLLRYGGGEVLARHLINCGGLQSDRIARMCGLDPGLRIVPFRGGYCELSDRSARLVRNLVYPVPDPRLPFLGVHFTRKLDGSVEVGPNAVLAWSREGYEPWSFSARDTLSMLSYPGFWRMAARYWKTGATELRRSLSRRVLLGDVRRMVPELRIEDLRPGGAGVRAQAVTPDGLLVDDFRLLQGGGMLHVLNAPSPAATASLSIGRSLAALAEKTFGLS